MQAFIGAYNGDIRRVIVELQAALHSNTSLKVQINKSLDDYQSILELIIDEKLDSALEKMFEEIYSGKTMKNICIGLHDVIVNGEMETRRKYKLLGVIGETEWRSQTMTPRVLASWMIAQTK